MNLDNNPFYILEIPCTSGNEKVISSAEQRMFFNDPKKYNIAQNILLNVKKRLSAEMDWFLDVEGTRLQDIHSCINERGKIDITGLSDLSKFNAIAYHFELLNQNDLQGIVSTILDLDKLFYSLDYTKLTEEINRVHIISGMPSVDDNDVLAEINRKCSEISQNISDKFNKMEDDIYIKVITSLAEKYASDTHCEAGSILVDVMAEYETRMMPKLQERTENLRKQIGNVQTNAGGGYVSGQIYLLTEAMKKWDVIAQPLQLIAKARGIPHQLSINVASEIKALAVFLHNKKGMSQEASTIIEAMQSVFAELPDISFLLDIDANRLKEIRNNEKEDKAYVDELNAIQRLARAVSIEPTDENVASLICRVTTIDQKLQCISDMDPETLTGIRSTLCKCTIDTATDLTKKNMPKQAYTIASAMQKEFSDISSLSADLNKILWMLGLLVPKSEVLTNPQIQNQTVMNASCEERCNTGNKTVRRKGKKVIFVLVLVLVIILGALGIHFWNKGNVAIDPYVRKEYTVTLSPREGKGGTSSVQVTVDSPMPAATAPSLEGFRFGGYFSSINGLGVQYYDAEMNSVHDWENYYSGILYAYWIREK